MNWRRTGSQTVNINGLDVKITDTDKDLFYSEKEIGDAVAEALRLNPTWIGFKKA